jgi:hypothetical protein
LAKLQAIHGLTFVAQSSPIRVYSDEDYRAAGIRVSERLDACPMILAVKEVPAALLAPGKTYRLGSCGKRAGVQHTHIAACLNWLLLVDYEKISDEQTGA